MSISSIEYFRHIQNEIRFVLENTGGLNMEQFVSDEVLKRSVVRSLEIIGEAVK